jgi:anti-sigma factor RsiW
MSQDDVHDIVVEHLEAHLSGQAPAAFHNHLRTCASCASAVAEMGEISGYLREFRANEGSVPEPSLGFYTRVENRIVDSQRKEAWGLFSPGAAFFRRIAFASLLALAAIGGLLIDRESTQQADGQDSVAIFASHEPSTQHTESSDRNQLLVTLANYQE